MRKKPPVRLVVHLPETKEERDRLSRIMAELHGEEIIRQIRELDCPGEQKLLLLQDVMQAIQTQSPEAASAH